MTIHGKPCYKVKKVDLDRFLEKQGISMNIHGEGERISMNNQGISMKETLKEVVRETITEERNQLMKPLEEQALYRLGRIEQENIFLRAKVETLLQENSELQEKIKALPDLQQEKDLAEEEAKNYLATIEELKRRLQAEQTRPWYRRIFS